MRRFTTPGVGHGRMGWKIPRQETKHTGTISPLLAESTTPLANHRGSRPQKKNKGFKPCGSNPLPVYCLIWRASVRLTQVRKGDRHPLGILPSNQVGYGGPDLARLHLPATCARRTVSTATTATVVLHQLTTSFPRLTILWPSRCPSVKLNLGGARNSSVITHPAWR